MATRVQVVFDCHDEQRMVEFWATALHSAVPDPPAPFLRWSDYWRSFDLPDEEVTESTNWIEDPDGVGPRIVFLVVPADKVVKNRLRLDLGVSGGRDDPMDVRRQRVDDEAARLVAAGATQLRVMETTHHHAIAMHDPEGNEFDIN